MLKTQKGTVIEKADWRKEKEGADHPYLAGGVSTVSCQVIMGWEGDITNWLHGPAGQARERRELGL